MNNVNFGEKIYNLRILRQLSQEELAEKLNISKQSVLQWEAGISMPETEKIITMSKVFEVPADYLLQSDETHDSELSDNKTEKTMLIYLTKCGAILALLSLLGLMAQYLLYILEVIKEYSFGYEICFSFTILGAGMVGAAKLMMKYTYKSQYHSGSKTKIIGIFLAVPAIILMILANYLPHLFIAIPCFCFYLAFAGVNIFNIVKRKYV